MKYPKVSIIIATLDCANALDLCIASIAKQDYPKNKVELIVVDGGSKDKTVDVARRFNCKVICKPGVLSEAAKAYGLQVATGELVADIAADNILPVNNWLKLLIAPLIKDKNLVGSYPLWYGYRKNDAIFNRYVALFGVNDPVPFYLGKADRLSYLSEDYNLTGDAKDMGEYYKVIFTPENMPTLGANGFLIRKSLLKKAEIDPTHFFHIDVVYDLVKQGYTSFAVVKTSIIHKTADTLLSLLRKRLNYMDKLYLKQLKNRRYHIVTEKEYMKLLLFALYSLTLIQPVLVSAKGFIRKKDWAWFLHPIVCLIIVFTYSLSISRSVIKSRKRGLSL